MSYSRNGLGATPGGGFTWMNLPKEGIRYNMEWATVGGARNDDIVRVMATRLKTLKAIPPEYGDSQIWTDFGGDLLTPGFRLPEGGTFIQGLLSFWVRVSYERDKWPGWQCGDVPCFNFGPSNTNMTEIRINEGMWNLLWQEWGTTPWRATDHGYVRVRLHDALYSYWIRNKLITLGYLTPDTITSVADDSAFVAAILRYYAEARGAGLDVGSWAGWPATGGCPTYTLPDGACYNFGPHHSDMFAPGEMIRLHPKLLAVLVNSPYRPSQIAASAKAATGALARVQIKRPIFGSALTMNKQPAQGQPVISEAARQNVAAGIAAAMSQQPGMMFIMPVKTGG